MHNVSILFPANEKDDKNSQSDVVVVPLERQFPGYLGPGPFGQQPIVDTGIFSGPFFNPFGSFLQNFECKRRLITIY